MASQDWPEITKYAGLVCAQAHRQELIQDLYKQSQDPVRGTVAGGMIKYTLTIFPSCACLLCLSFSLLAVMDSWPLCVKKSVPSIFFSRVVLFISGFYVI